MEQNPVGNRCSVCAGRKSDKWGLHDYPLAMVYSPVQEFRGLYDLRTALQKVTLFSELGLPLETEGQSKKKKRVWL